MAENRLMTLDERLAIGVECARLDREGKEAEARALAKTRPMPAYMARILMEKVDWGKDFLRTCGWNMAEGRLSMEKTGLTIGILEAVCKVTDGRIGLRTKGKTEVGRENLVKGLELGKQIFSELKDCRDPELMLLAEYAFVNQELEGARTEEKIGRASYQSATHDFDDAFLSLKSVKDSAMYQGAENTHPHRAPFRYKGMPNDSFHIAYSI
jgi:hypothetical protein